MNLHSGLGEAFQSSVPVLAIVGQPPNSVEGRGAFQDSSGIGRTVDAVQMFSAVSKFTKRVDEAELFWSTLEDAVVTALEGRPGPSVLLFPRSTYTMDVPDFSDGFGARVRERLTPPALEPMLLRGALDFLRLARQPVLILGQGAQRTRNPNAVIEFADALNIPVATTMGARGEFPNSHRNYLGVLGVSGHPSVHAFIRDKADVLLLGGTSLNTMTRAPFARDRTDLPEKQLIAISTDLGELRRVVQDKTPKVPAHDPSKTRSWWPSAVNDIACEIESDLGTAFAAMHELWHEAPFKVRGLNGYVMQTFVPTRASGSPRTAPSQRSAALPEETAALSHAVALKQLMEGPPSERHLRADAPLLQSVALEVVASHLPTKGTVLYDAGNCAAAALHLMPIPPRVTTVIALGLGGMGYAIAGAIGAQLGAPEGTRSVVLAGDGAFLITGLEVHTAVDFQVPVLFVVFNNNMHGMCATRQQVFFESRYEAVFYSPVNVAEVARGLAPKNKLWVGRATTRQELEAALADFERDPMRPGVLELVLKVEEVPPFTPFLPEESVTQPGSLSIVPPERK